MERATSSLACSVVPIRVCVYGRQVANRGMQEQLQRNAGVITSLQDEIAMFRQMCLNLQGEVRALTSRLGSATPASAPTQRPPPGM